MTASKHTLEKRLEKLESRRNGGDGPEITIRMTRIGEGGEEDGTFATFRAWENELGEWHGETTEYNLQNDR